MNCTETPGEGPIFRAEDAVSSYSATAATGELTVTDFTEWVSDGEDMFFAARYFHTCTPQLQNFLFFLRSTKICIVLTSYFTDVVNGQTASSFPAPKLYSKPLNLPERMSETIAWTSSTKSSASKSCIPVKLHFLSLEGLPTLPLVRFFNNSSAPSVHVFKSLRLNLWYLVPAPKPNCKHRSAVEYLHCNCLLPLMFGRA